MVVTGESRGCGRGAMLLVCRCRFFRWDGGCLVAATRALRRESALLPAVLRCFRGWRAILWRGRSGVRFHIVPHQEYGRRRFFYLPASGRRLYWPRGGRRWE